MALTGTLDDLTFAEIVQVINQGRKNGELIVKRGRDTARVTFSQGEIVQAELIVPSPAKPIRGAEVIYRLLGYCEGDFEFQRSDRLYPRMIQETTDELILEGMKRLDEWQKVEEEISDWNVVLRLKASKVGDHYEELSEEGRAILRLVDARRNVATIIRESGVEASKALLTITELIALDLVEKWDGAASNVIRQAGTGAEGKKKRESIYAGVEIPHK